MTPSRYKWAVVIVATLGSFMSVLDLTVVSIAIAHLSQEFVAAGRDVMEQIGAFKESGGSKVCKIASFCAYQEYCVHGATGRTIGLLGPRERQL